MTHSEAGLIVAKIAAAFPRQPFSRETVSVYVEELRDLDASVCLAAVDRLIRDSEWPPTIAAIRQETCLAEVSLPEPETAWELVCRRWGEVKGSGDSTVTLSPEIRAALGHAGIDAFGYWTAEDRTWLRRAFLDTYGTMRRRLIRSHNLGLEPDSGLPQREFQRVLNA